jgi:hypothetical protein
MKKSLIGLLAVILIFLFASCTPKVSLSGATIPAEAKSVSVGFFTNNTSLGPPTLSQQFTERMRDMVSRQTNLTLLKQNGDLQFEGYLSDYNVAPVAVTNDVSSQNRLTISVKVAFFNKFEASKNFDQTFTRFADFKSTESLNSISGQLHDEIFRQITEDIFNRAFNNW